MPLFLEKMNILLLGSFGFIGTNIIKYIDSLCQGTNIIAFDRFPEHLDHIQFESVKKVYSGDFSDDYLLGKVFEENDIDLVIHSLSASVPSASQDNKFDIKNNVLPTIGLLNQMVKHQVRDIVFISSGGAVYGDYFVNNEGHSEDDNLFPKSAYGVSKLVIEKYLYLYSVQHGIKSLVLRLSNPYGPYHYSQKQGIINIALERALDGKPFEIWGDGNGKKDYIYIEDFCAILMRLIEEWNEPYFIVNVGSGQLLSVNDIVGVIQKNVASHFTWTYKNANELDVQNFKLNLSLLQSMIGDFRYTTFEEGIYKTHEWYLSKKR